MRLECNASAIRTSFFATVALAFGMSGCGSSNPPPAPAPAPTSTYTVGGTVSGLIGSVTLTNGGGEARTVATSGSFTFATALNGGATYNVAVSAQPATQTCTVTNGSGTITAANISNVAVTCVTNTVSPPLNTAPAITQQPANQSVTAPAAATFSAAASGTPTPTLQWQLSTDGVSYSNIGGATGATHTTSAINVSQSGHSYRVVATNTVGSATSNAVVLTVVAAPVAPVIAAQPAQQTVSEPAAATFSVIASGTPAPTYQWQLSVDGVTYTTIVGATANSYTTGATSLAQSGRQYRVVVTNVAGSATSDPAALSVSGAVGGATIVFTRNNGTVNTRNDDLYAIREVNGTEIRLTTSSDNEGLCGVTPERVIYQRAVTGGSLDIYSVKLDGTDTRPLATSSDDEICNKIVSSGPAAGRLIYRRDTATSGRDIYSVNADGTQAAPIANGPENEDFAALTENYNVIYQITNSQNSDVYSAPLMGGSFSPLATTFSYEGYAGSTAGLVIYGRDMISHGDLWSVGELGVNNVPFAADPAADENLVGITPGGAFLVMSRDINSQVRTLYANSIPLATDGDYIGYAGSTNLGVFYFVYAPGQQNSDLHYVGVDGTGHAVLANSADAEGLAFITNNGKAIYSRYAITGSTVTLGDLYLVNLDGTGRTTLTATVDHENFAALLGTQVLYQREIANSVNNVQLWAVNLDGSNNHKFFLPGGPAYFAAATPSGRVLVENRTQIGRDLYVVEGDGTGARALAMNAVLVALVP